MSSVINLRDKKNKKKGKLLKVKPFEQSASCLLPEGQNISYKLG